MQRHFLVPFSLFMRVKIRFLPPTRKVGSRVLNFQFPRDCCTSFSLRFELRLLTYIILRQQCPTIVADNMISIPYCFIALWGLGILSLQFAEGFIGAQRTATTAPFTTTPFCHNSSNRHCSLLCLASTYFGSMPFKKGKVSVAREGENGSEEFDIGYTLVRPMSLSSQQAAPIVVLHGGPSLPSNYCFPLAKHVPYRSILFYDQLGCGKSDEPENLEYYSIDQSVDDLETLLDKLSIRRFHLYGHSYGGILAYEYLKRRYERMAKNKNEEQENCECLSVILSSAPTSIQQLEADWEEMEKALLFPQLFSSTHLCRTPLPPKPLQDAYANAGTVWSGTTAIADYKAQPSKTDSGDEIFMPSALVLRGEYDVVTESCSAPWKKELLRCRSVREGVLEGCSHHGLLENGEMYGEIVDLYFGEYD